MHYQRTRADYPIGTQVRYRDSGATGTVVSIEETDYDEYGGPDIVFVKMGGLINRSHVDDIEPL